MKSLVKIRLKTAALRKMMEPMGTGPEGLLPHQKAFFEKRMSIHKMAGLRDVIRAKYEASLRASQTSPWVRSKAGRGLGAAIESGIESASGQGATFGIPIQEAASAAAVSAPHVAADWTRRAHAALSPVQKLKKKRPAAPKTTAEGQTVPGATKTVARSVRP